MIDLKMLREQAPHVGLIDEELIELLDYIDQLQQEIQEQCRVNGICAEREVGLLSRIIRLEKENASLKQDAARYEWLRDNCTKEGTVVDVGAGAEIWCTIDEAIDTAMEASNAKAD